MKYDSDRVSELNYVKENVKKYSKRRVFLYLWIARVAVILYLVIVVGGVYYKDWQAMVRGLVALLIVYFLFYAKLSKTYSIYDEVKDSIEKGECKDG